MATPPFRSAPPPAREVEVEVLPGGADGRSIARDPMLALLARVMDALFTVPGTKVKVGLDPLISLLPVVGSPISALVSLLLLGRAAQAGVPNAVLARMAVNVILNTALGEVPIVGDFVSVFFRSNVRNYELLQKHAGTKKAYSWSDRLLVAGIVAGVMLIVLCTIIGFLWLGTKIWKAIVA